MKGDCPIRTGFRHRAKVVCAVFLPALLLSCSKSGSFSTAKFIVIDGLVEKPVSFSTLDLSVAPPIRWRPIDDDALNQFQNVLGSSGLSENVFEVKPLAVFVDSVIGGMMYVAHIEAWSKEFSATAERLYRFLASRRDAVPFTVSPLAVGDVDIYLYQMQFSEAINFKILGRTASNHWFFMEYVCRADDPMTVQRLFESSLGTLKTVASSPSG
jgi:hypothetical protein